MPLTEDQKLANKEARRLRDAAYTQRLKSYRAAQSEAQVVLKSSPEMANRDRASKALDVCIAKRDGTVLEIQKKIAALKMEIDQINGSSNLEVTSLNDERRRTNDVYLKSCSVVMDAVDEEFSDVAGLYSAAAWKPISDFLPADMPIQVERPKG